MTKLNLHTVKLNRFSTILFLLVLLGCTAFPPVLAYHFFYATPDPRVPDYLVQKWRTLPVNFVVDNAARVNDFETPTDRNLV